MDGFKRVSIFRPSAAKGPVLLSDAARDFRAGLRAQEFRVSGSVVVRLLGLAKTPIETFIIVIIRIPRLLEYPSASEALARPP